MADKVSLRVLAPYAGEDIASAPYEANKASGLMIENFLPGRRGKLYLRGYTQFATTYAAADNPALWASPKNSEDLFFWQNSGAPNMNIVQPSGGGPGAAFATPAGFTTGPARDHAVFGSFTYGASTRNNFGRSPMWKWDGQTVAAGFSTLVQGPDEVQSLTVFASRLMALAQRAPGALGVPATQTNSILYWTDADWGGADTLASWQDDVTGLVNKIVLPTGGTYHSLIVVGDVLYILGTAGICALRGSGPSNWVLKKVLTLPVQRALDGSAGVPAIAVDNTLHFMSDQGIMSFDGYSARVISNPIRERIAGATNTTTEAVRLSSDYVGWRIGDNWSDAQSRWYAYHIPTGSWCRLSSTALTGTGIPKWLGATNTGAIWAANNTRIANISSLVLPENTKAEVLVDTQPQNARDGLTGPVITATARSRLLDLGTLTTKAQLNKIRGEVILQQKTAPNPATLTMSVKDEAGNVLGSAVVNADTSAQKKLVTFDCFEEVDNCFLEWVLVTNATQYITFEVHDAEIDYQPARSRSN